MAGVAFVVMVVVVLLEDAFPYLLSVEFHSLFELLFSNYFLLIHQLEEPQIMVIRRVRLREIEVVRLFDCRLLDDGIGSQLSHYRRPHVQGPLGVELGKECLQGEGLPR